MNIVYTFAVLYFSTSLLCNAAINAQKNSKSPIDSALEANSDKWKVKLHKGLGMGKPEFGPYGTLDVEKLDSPVLHKRIKEGSYVGGTVTSNSWDWDFSKYEAVEKKKAFRMMVTNTTDTTEILFSLYSVTHDKKLTFFGELMSKDDKGKNINLGYRKNASGIVSITADSLPWRFLIEDSLSTKQHQNPYFIDSKRMTSMYMITDDDSLYTEPIMYHSGDPGNEFYFERQAGVYLNNATGSHIAALKFGAWGDGSDPFYVWIRKDMQPGYQKAIASLFALLMMIHAA